MSVESNLRRLSPFGMTIARNVIISTTKFYWKEPLIIKRILCPIDFSEHNEPANEYASVLAKATGARIIYFHTLVPSLPYGTEPDNNEQTNEDRDRELLEKYKPTIEGVPASYVIEVGTPTDRIIKYARDNEIDLIVLATHGRSGLGRLLMGSVAETVLRKGECPVLAVRADAIVHSEN